MHLSRTSSRRLPVRGAWILLSGLLGIASLGTGQALASPGPCPDASGVTVVVDFQSLGGQTIIACSDGPVSSGFEALSAAGIASSPVTSNSLFICRIQGLPSEQTCADIPPANAYWSYWHADRGGAWVYATTGAGSRTPPEGSVEGWSFNTDPTRAEGTPPRTPPPAGETGSTPESTVPPPDLPEGQPPPAPAPVPAPAPAPAPARPAPAPVAPAPAPAPARPGVQVPPVQDGDESADDTADQRPTSQDPDLVPIPAPLPTSGAGGAATLTRPSNQSDVGASTDPEANRSEGPQEQPSSEPLQVDSGTQSGTGTLIGLGAVASLAGVALVVARRRRDNG